MHIGERLLSILSRAESSVRIAAPFIKIHSLERALSEIPAEVEVTCVTRWRAEDIASGVCDLEIFDHLQNRKNASLLVHPQLHAKFFASNNVCLVGSANMTHTALGWRSPSNLELFVELDAHEHDLNEWWAKLLESSIVATQAMKAALADQAEACRVIHFHVQKQTQKTSLMELFGRHSVQDGLDFGKLMSATRINCQPAPCSQQRQTLQS